MVSVSGQLSRVPYLSDSQATVGQARPLSSRSRRRHRVMPLRCPPESVNGSGAVRLLECNVNKTVSF